jgi:hypothetical protein
VEQRWRTYTWGGVRVALRIFLQMQLSICVADTFTGGGIFLQEGGQIGTVGSKAARGFFVSGDVFRQRYILVAALILALPI